MNDYINEKLEKFNNDTKNKKIAIIGLGVSNLPLIEYFKNNGSYITVFDERNKEQIDNDVINKLDKSNV